VQDVDLALGELAQRPRGLGGCGKPRERLDHPARDARAEQRIARGDGPHSIDQLLGRRLLEQEAGTLLQLAAAACLLAALPVFLWLLRGRGGRLGAAAIGLLYASTLGNVGDAGASAYQWAAATDGVSAADVAIVERAQESAAGVAVSLLVLVGLLGFPLLAAALYRARTTPPAVPALIAAAFVSFFFPIPKLVGGLLVVAAFGLVARTSVRRSA
jgi:hypothetical protein